MSRVVGMAPGLLLLPAQELVWELKNKLEIRIPNEGFVSQLLESTKLEDGVTIPGDDSFLISEPGFVYLWQIVRILFAKNLYPKLENNQVFHITTLQIEDNELVLHGEVIEHIVQE